MKEISDEDIPFRVRPMNLEDLDEVIEIERACFTLPWPAAAFRHDLTQNPYAHYFIVEPCRAQAVRQQEEGELAETWWRRLFWGRVHAKARPEVLGYAGFWALVDEAHISNVAVAPAWRGRGLGRLLLIAIIEKATSIGMNLATLEVRLSNIAAQNLYRSFGFAVMGQRPGYYSDNNEDALIMTTGLLASATFQSNLFRIKMESLKRLRRLKPAED